MFCNNCGKQVDDNTTFCPYCGKQIGTPAAAAAQQPTPPSTPAPAPAASTDSNTIAIIGFIFSFFGGIIGLVCSIIGYVNAKKGAPHKGLALAGIIISCAWAGILLILLIAGGGALAAAWGAMNELAILPALV